MSYRLLMSAQMTFLSEEKKLWMSITRKKHLNEENKLKKSQSKKKKTSQEDKLSE